MRLTADEIAGIRAAAAEVFGPSAVVRLFGSRVDDARRGGDIDLMIEVAPGRGGLRAEIAAQLAIERRIGERRIDVLTVEQGAPLTPIAEIAYRDGVVL